MKKGLAPIINKKTKILILGSAPSEISLKKQQYYGNNGNQFWKIIFDYFQVPFSTDYEERVQLLLNNQIGLWDIYHSFNRIGSLDRSIKENTINDFRPLLAQSTIKLVIANGKQCANEILENHLFEQMTVISCISTSGAANGLAAERKKGWFEALNTVFL
ncbi:DNA-deoxyinosine glycosylase [Enterococcus sp. LJL99]